MGEPVKRHLERIQKQIDEADRLVTTVTEVGKRVDPIAEQLTQLLARAGVDSESGVKVNGTKYIFVVASSDFANADERALKSVMRTHRLETINTLATDPVLRKFETDAPEIARKFQKLAVDQLDRDARHIIWESKGDHAYLPLRLLHRSADYIDDHRARGTNAAVITLGISSAIAATVLGNPVIFIAAVVGGVITLVSRTIWDTRLQDRAKHDDVVAVRRQMHPGQRRKAIVDLGVFATNLEHAALAAQKGPAVLAAPRRRAYEIS